MEEPAELAADPPPPPAEEFGSWLAQYVPHGRPLILRSVLAGLAMILVLIGIGLSPDDLPGQLSFVSYQNALVRFDHPSAWKVAHYDEQTNYFTLLAAMSNQPMHDPCAPHSTSSCTVPLSKLAPGGVIVLWTGNAQPNWVFAKAPGVARTINGRAARVLVSSPGICKSLGGDETVSAWFQMKAADDYYQVAACLRGPNIAKNERAIMASINSTKFAVG